MKGQRQPTAAERVERVFARRLRDLREERGLSQARLAAELARSGLHLNDLSILRIEKNADGPEGARGIRLGEAAIIARTLGVRLNDMLRETSSAAEQFEVAAGQLIAAQLIQQSAADRLNNAQSHFTEAVQQYEGSLALLSDEERTDARALLMIDQVERYKRLQELSARQEGLHRYFTYLTEQEQKLSDELHERDPKTERFTYLDRQARHRWVMDTIVKTVTEIVQIQGELQAFQDELQKRSTDERVSD